MGFPSVVKFSRLKQRNPEYLGDYWKRCRVLYLGGPALLEDSAALKKIMPRHNREDDDVYAERLARAYYIPYAGAIIDKLGAELAGRPIDAAVDRDEDDKADPEPDPFYSEFVKDVSRPGGECLSINQLAREQVLTALQCGRGWALVDLPRKPSAGYANLAEQDAAGGRRATVTLYDPEAVIDWETDEAGGLTFAIIQEEINRRDGIDSDRDLVTLRYRYLTPTEWAIYEITYSKKRDAKGPADDAEVKLVDQDTHTFGRVPLVQFKVPAGLWAMAKLEAMARAHMNQRCALSWGQLKTLFAQPILYAAPPNPMDPVTEDGGRAQQVAGPGMLWVLAEKDRLEYASPDTAPYDHIAQDLAVLRDEMHRVLHSMAMSVDNSGAALQRSAESKSVDQAAASVILRALGQLVREHVDQILQLVARGRGEDLEFVVTGMDSFDEVTLTQLVNDALVMESIAIPSATFQRHWKAKIVKAALGPDATEEQIEEILDELEEAITQDALLAPGMPGVPMPKAPAGPGDQPAPGEPEQSSKTSAKAKGKPKSKGKAA